MRERVRVPAPLLVFQNLTLSVDLCVGRVRGRAGAESVRERVRTQVVVLWNLALVCKRAEVT